jgi:hypothetical protein
MQGFMQILTEVFTVAFTLDVGQQKWTYILNRKPAGASKKKPAEASH